MLQNDQKSIDRNNRMKRLMSHPNTLTLFRILAVPIIVVMLMVPNKLTAWIAALLFSAAAITDYLDGYLARQRGLVTKLGKVMDPVADKLLISCSFIMLADVGWIPAWVVCIIVARELAVTGLRNIVAHEGEDVSSSWLGKYKTGFQISAAIPHLIHYSYFGINMVAIGNFFLVGAVVFTLWSGVDYFMKYRKLMDL